MVKKIHLSQNKYALVDDEDYEYINQWKWHESRKENLNSLVSTKYLLF